MSATHNTTARTTLTRRQLTLAQMRHPLGPWFTGDSLFYQRRPGHIPLYMVQSNYDSTCHKGPRHVVLAYKLRANRRAANSRSRKGMWG